MTWRQTTLSRPAGTTDALLAHSAWRANLKQELLAPVTALIELAETLRKDAQDRAPAEFQADLAKIHAAGTRLLGLVNELLDPARTDDSDAGRMKHLRHELRTPLNHIIGFTELWLEDADDDRLGAFLTDLREVHALGKQVLARLDDLVSFPKVANDLDQADPTTSAMIKDLLASMPGRGTGSGAPPEAGSVLVVDDNELNRDVLCRWLRREGHTATEAADGIAALELLRSRRFDLVLLDIIMPGMNGFQVLERLKADEKLRHLPVIMISAFDEVDSVVRCIEMGAEDHLPKPFNPVLLKARIGACLEKKRLRDREAGYLEQIRREQQRSDELLRVILPAEIVTELKATNAVQPRRHENVAVLFADIVGFTPYCDATPPEQLFPYLQQLIESWEEIALCHGVEKIKTIGDAFMAAAGLLQKTEPKPVLQCVRLGLDMIELARALPTKWQVRVGIHVGPVVAGVIGRRQYLFDLWGDTVNTAARMESHGVPGSITLSRAAWDQIADRCRGQSLGVISIKGKGPMEMMRFDGFA
jgi:class 3 adenylate cyclase